MNYWQITNFKYNEQEENKVLPFLKFNNNINEKFKRI